MGKKPKGKSVAARMDEPPDDKAPYVEIRRVGPNQELEFVILSDALEGYTTHYFGRATYPHLASDPLCQGCAMKLPVRWRGYLLVLGHPDWTMFLAEVTHRGYEGCPDFKRYKGDLVGRKLRQRRKGLGANGRQMNFISAEKVTFQKIRYIPDIGPILEQIWEGKGTKKEVPNE